MVNDNKSKKRSRRTKVEIEKSLFNAATGIIENYGFSKLTVTGLSQKAKIEPVVFYNRYKDLDDFIEKYVRNYDYWLRDSLITDFDKHPPVENLKRLLDALIDSLVDNVPMQKLIAWEMNENNYITRRTAQSRDISSTYIIEYFTEALKNCSVRFNYGASLLIGGLYYLIIHRELGTFNFIDFRKKESIDNLKLDLYIILDKIYGDYEEPVSNNNFNPYRDQMEKVAKDLFRNDVDYQIIKKVTKLSDATLKSINKNLY